jgi:hypothetical protein
MASHNRKDRTAEGLSDRCPNAPLAKAAHAPGQAKSLAAEGLGWARWRARDYGRPAPLPQT